MVAILRIKHWQIFIIIFLTAFWVSPSPLKEIVNSISIFFLILWMYSIMAWGLNKVNWDNKYGKMAIYRINSILILPTICLLYWLNQAEQTLINIVIATFSMLLLLFMLLFNIVLVSKMIATLEKKATVHFNEYTHYILGFLIPFIGVWFIQPKINKLERTARK